MNFLSALTPTSLKTGGVSRSDMKKGSKLADSVKNVVQYRKLSSEQQKRLKMVASYGRASEYKKAIQQKVSGKLQEFGVLNLPDSNNNTTAQLNNDEKIIHTQRWESSASSLIREYKDYSKELQNQSSEVPSARSDELKSQIVSLESKIKSVRKSLASLQGQTDSGALQQIKILSNELTNLNLKKSRKEKDLKLEPMQNTRKKFYDIVTMINKMATHLDDYSIPETNPIKTELAEACNELITKKNEIFEAARQRR
ncbi:hypothetical protein [Vibrio aestuarianus]|uniref:Uncharacterized protein n=1 Tax=Vibrio aestuarianus TaxID=28171 RepID=A0A9X4ES54_9VIBR|nr:hypothetical protein [Vibrio aestuarianus]MDE1241261.1 hypothetical protein [Vibrio aestuarianus]